MKKIIASVLMILGLSVVAIAEPEMMPTYKIGAYADVEAAKAKLTANGFEVLATYPSFKKGTTILYTNAAMKAEGNKPMRGFAAYGRVLVDDERQQISVANPLYFMNAFMQKEYNQAVAQEVLGSLEKAFGPFTDSQDVWETKDLAGYHFMISRPYYEDMAVVGEGSTADLLAKVNAAKGTVLKLDEDRYIAFVDLDARTSGFVKKIGTQNSHLLPWAVLIEGGKAQALRADYMIAISYPLLNMGGFMGIMTVPGSLIDSLKNTFK